MSGRLTPSHFFIMQTAGITCSPTEQRIPSSFDRANCNSVVLALRRMATLTILISMAWCCDAAPALTNDVQSSTKGSRESTVLSSVVLACCVLLVVAMVRGADSVDAGPAQSGDDDLSWYSDDVDYIFWDRWQKRFRRSLLGNGRVTASLIPLLQTDTHDPSRATEEQIRKSHQLYVYLDALAVKGRMKMILTRHQHDRRGDVAWKQIYEHYEKTYKDARTQSHKKFFYQPDGSQMDLDTWMNRMASCYEAVKGQGSQFSEHQLLVNAFRLSETKAVFTPPEVSRTVRLMVTTELDQTEAMADTDDGKAAKMAEHTLEWLLDHIENDMRVNPAAAAASTSTVQQVSASNGPPRICKNFAAGRHCRFGNKCKFVHAEQDSSTSAEFNAQGRGRGRGRGRGKGKGRGQQNSGGRAGKTSSNNQSNTSNKQKPLCPDFLNGKCGTSKKCVHGFRHNFSFHEQKLLSAKFRDK